MPRLLVIADAAACKSCSSASSPFPAGPSAFATAMPVSTAKPDCARLKASVRMESLPSDERSRMIHSTRSVRIKRCDDPDACAIPRSLGAAEQDFERGLEDHG